MYNLKNLTIDALKFNIERQKAWLKHYAIVDPSNTHETVINEIVKELNCELLSRGAK